MLRAHAYMKCTSCRRKNICPRVAAHVLLPTSCCQGIERWAVSTKFPSFNISPRLSLTRVCLAFSDVFRVLEHCCHSRASAWHFLMCRSSTRLPVLPLATVADHPVDSIALGYHARCYHCRSSTRLTVLPARTMRSFRYGKHC